MNPSKYRTDCRRFSGYRPCYPDRADCDGCDRFDPRGERILVINLDAIGDVIRSTAVLHPMKRRFPQSHVTWITLPRSAPLLENNPFVDRILPADASLGMILASLRFDRAYNVDKGIPSGAMMNAVNAPVKMGFGIDADGVILPLNDEADELFRVGLDDRLKFLVNRKTENQLLAEAFGFEYSRDPCIFRFTPSEEHHLAEVRERFGLDDTPMVVGVNTGCSNLFPNKKLPLQYQRMLIHRLRQARPAWPVLLLGGIEDGVRNAELAADLGMHVIPTPTDEGLRRGMTYTQLADVVFTGDSLGMHMAIALGKRTVVWFGLTCEQEIEIYDRGEKLTADVKCRPCWRKECDKPVKCWDSLDPDMALAAIIRQGELVLQEKKGTARAAAPPRN